MKLRIRETIAGRNEGRAHAPKNAIMQQSGLPGFEWPAELCLEGKEGASRAARVLEMLPS